MPTAAAETPFTPRLDVAARSAAGIEGSTAENQDNYLLIDAAGRARFLRDEAETQQRVAGWLPGHARIAVLDGMGGHGHGREAAEAAVAGLLEMAPCHDGAELAHRLARLHGRLQQQFGTGANGLRPGTTLTLLEIPEHGPALLFHVGDSRLYELDGDRVSPLTVDHVPATSFVLQGLLGEQEWWAQVHGEHRAQISQAFILGNALSDPAVLSDPLYELDAEVLPPFLAHLADRRPVELEPGKTYLLATDGFWACAEANRWVARWPRILAQSDSARDKVDALFGEMNDHPPAQLHHDNLTAIVIRPVSSAAADTTAVPYL
ncbi:PP2C family protein-serine/threonine phosphatase [Pseudoduganella sp. GCM10020061]|uniref:PP2C family protein-serine/threonine phosphatase n=1 Tax=Pseudoduganella sp. GCM10020061 TaxID=3317345 RepID=UPI00362C9422